MKTGLVMMVGVKTGDGLLLLVIAKFGVAFLVWVILARGWEDLVLRARI